MLLQHIHEIIKSLAFIPAFKLTQHNGLRRSHLLLSLQPQPISRMLTMCLRVQKIYFRFSKIQAQITKRRRKSEVARPLL
ncbi:CLUMA_CG010127, isoform A [Clunio marinus]|uniref:CLUMA_CG010127, isoform A n=1 Tax=Clunio marinus TaxID=568069 RepID=A0A1J1I8Y9_9DIPT|nr:CLUMA_CG010127, isoform A [Clunio marinus]